MAWLNAKELKDLKLKSVGKNAKISNKAVFYNPELIEIGDNSRIDDFCVISGKVFIGKNVHIAVFSNIAGGELGITLEDFSGVAYNCNLFTQSDDYSGLTLSNPTIPDKFKTEIKKSIRIGKHCIIGASSLIFPGVYMKEGCSLGAMSMLTKSTEPWGIYFGVPAKRIKKRKDKLLALEEEYLSSIK